ncbi:hypothetical protein ACFPLB_04560 [Aquamicrobium segne]|uniref:Uncharacterized protein n=1 Tax=Aquamicrobium segne TaxID=469547 RepID=A0ABW0GXV1_9HYPH
MIKIIASAAAFALLSGSAFAGSITGPVRSYDNQARTIVFESGETASVPLHVAVPADLGAGSQATVIINDNTGRAGVVFSDSLLGR